MFFTNRQNSASRLNKRNLKKGEKMSLYHYKREKKRRKKERARESVLSEAIEALNRVDEVFVISPLHERHEQIT